MTIRKLTENQWMQIEWSKIWLSNPSFLPHPLRWTLVWNPLISTLIAMVKRVLISNNRDWMRKTTMMSLSTSEHTTKGHKIIDQFIEKTKARKERTNWMARLRMKHHSKGKEQRKQLSLVIKWIGSTVQKRKK